MTSPRSGHSSKIRPEAFGYSSMRSFIVLGTLWFATEMLALAGFARFGWQLGDGDLPGLILAILLAVIMFGIWATFRTKGDPTRVQAPIVAIPGQLRLVVEWTYFGLGVWTFLETDAQTWAVILLIGVVIFNVFAWRRQLWMLRRR